MFNVINELVTKLSKYPFDPKLCFSIATEYELVGQTAAAISFYLRAAEYGYYSHPEYVYASLLKSANCFENQKNRQVLYRIVLCSLERIYQQIYNLLFGYTLTTSYLLYRYLNY
jgi:hypothetical protein